METTVLHLPCELDRAQLYKKSHIEPDGPLAEQMEELIDQALKVGKPKAAYKVAYIDDKGDDFVVVDGIKFSSRVLRVNLKGAFKVVPFVVTCGRELGDMAANFTDMLDRFCFDAIMEAIVRSACSKFFAQIDEQLNFGHTSNMNPGSLPDWPIKEQAPLFALLGDVKTLTGVELNDSFLMSPIKSISGFHFPKEGNFESCQLCPREKCPGRRAPYDKNLYEQKYKQE